MKVLVVYSGILLVLFVNNLQCSYLSIYEEYENAMGRSPSSSLNGHHSDSDKFSNNRHSSLDQLYGGPFVPYPPASSQAVPRSEPSYDYDDYSSSGSVEVPLGGQEEVFVSHPKEVLPVFDTPNVERSYTVGVDADTVELSKRSIIVKPIIQYVIHQIKKTQANLHDPGKDHVSWHPNAEAGKGWWDARDPRASGDGSFSYGNGHREAGQGMPNGLPQYEANDSINNNHGEGGGGFGVNAGAYFDSQGQGPPPGMENNNHNNNNNNGNGHSGPFSLPEGRHPQGSDAYSSMGDAVPIPFSPQDLRGSYGPPPPPNSRMRQSGPNMMNYNNGPPPPNNQAGHSGGMERPPMNPSQTCSTSWGWGCVQTNSEGGGPGMSMVNLNQASQGASSSTSNNFNSPMDGSSRSILTQNFGANPSIAEAISSLLKSVAGSSGGGGGGRGFRYPQHTPRQEYGPPGFMPGSPTQMPMEMTTTATPPPETTTITTTTTTTTTPPPPTTTMPAVLIASTTVADTPEVVEGSTMTGEGEEHSKHRPPRPSSPKGPKRGQGRRNKGLNAYFKLLVAGGLGPDPSGGHEEEESSSHRRKPQSKSRGFSFGINYPPKRRGLFTRRHPPRQRGGGNFRQQNHQQNAESRLGYNYDYIPVLVQ